MSVDFHPRFDEHPLVVTSSLDWSVQIFGLRDALYPQKRFDNYQHYVLGARWSPTHPYVSFNGSADVCSHRWRSPSGPVQSSRRANLSIPEIHPAFRGFVIGMVVGWQLFGSELARQGLAGFRSSTRLETCLIFVASDYFYSRVSLLFVSLVQTPLYDPDLRIEF